MKITLEWLEKRGACRESIAFVRRNNLDGVEREWLSGSMSDWLDWLDEELRFTYEYNEHGDPVSETYRHDDGKSTTSTIEYTYDDKGRKLTETTSNGITFTHTYDDERGLSHLSAQGWTVVRDAQGRKVEESTSDGDRWTKWTYDYDDRGNLVRETSPTRRVWTYEYDKWNHRIAETTSAGRRREWTVVCDEIGNVLSTTPCWGDFETTTFAYERDSLGRLTRVLEEGEEVLRIDWPANEKETA